MTSERPFESNRGLRGGWRASPRRLLAHVVILLSPRTLVGGFEVSAINGDFTPQLLHQLQATVDLIGTRAPRVLARMQRDVKRILIVASGGPEYWPFADGFILNQRFTTESDVEFIALTMVHESAHARLWRQGIPYTSSLRERIERICVRQELQFAQHLPDSDDYSAYVTRKLSSPWWTDEAVSLRRAHAREAMWPRWLVRLHARVFGD
jgi:hypothetical protein